MEADLEKLAAKWDGWVRQSVDEALTRAIKSALNAVNAGNSKPATVLESVLAEDLSKIVCTCVPDNAKALSNVTDSDIRARCAATLVERRSTFVGRDHEGQVLEALSEIVLDAIISLCRPAAEKNLLDLGSQN